MAIAYPYSAIVGQQDMKLALLIAAVDQDVGGVLVFGDRGTGKSTAIRALAALMPKVRMVKGCSYNCSPDADKAQLCDACRELGANLDAHVHLLPVPVVDLPLGATEDRVIGSLDLEKALRLGEKAFEPGLLARAHRGFLYIDEVNLLEDHIVDSLLDVAASGENVVEREGLSIRHPARFVLAGLIGLLNTARDRNRSLDITGCLMHREDSFFQVIEGRKSVVLALFELIRKDSRHKRVEMLYQSPVEQREFPDWVMGFVDLDGIDVSLLPGFSNFMSESTEPRQVLEELTRTRRMMLLFRAIS